MLLLFHKEECPYCQKVRQYLSDEHIQYVSLTSPDGAKSRKLLEKIGGENQVPFLMDVARAEMIYESDDIIEYLKDRNDET